jgi:hypothetical protein
MLRKPHPFGLLLVAFITLALVATGFSQRVLTSEDVALQSYLLSGGDLADLCADANGDGLPDHLECPACHIVAAANLPDAELTLQAADFVFVAKVVAPRESRALRTVLDPARGMRAPPLA